MDPTTNQPTAYPRFAPDATLIVDAGNGNEQWTGQQWNDYATECEDHGELFIVRLVEVEMPDQANPLADEVRRAAELLHQAAHEVALCDPEPARHVRLSPEQAHAVATAFEHIADDMGDYNAVEEPLMRVDGTWTTVVKNEDGRSRFDWDHVLAAARAFPANRAGELAGDQRLADELEAEHKQVASRLSDYRYYIAELRAYIHGLERQIPDADIDALRRDVAPDELRKYLYGPEQAAGAPAAS